MTTTDHPTRTHDSRGDAMTENDRAERTPVEPGAQSQADGKPFTSRAHEEPSTGQAHDKLLAQLGGTKGMVYTAIPITAFVTANAALGLPLAIGIALAVALALTVWRMARKEPFSAASGGLFGVAAAGGIAAWTGSAGGFFLIGIWTSFAGAVLFLASLLARRPVTGLAWNALHGNRHPWRSDRPSLLAHDIATTILTALFGARFAVQQWLYENDSTGWLAFAKVGMGTPLFALALLVVLWAFRRSTKRLVQPNDD
ncbi:DUF3159 domain-containing protein [Streptomyces sp. 4503]|uniref:DUF3159 domain-containing protein n=2 Tax=Streptomyces niphimycinicus TaxID=2842201 RepID=A0ABS6C9G6_9ACTN|nr:DUF3159 domain-containing protein [Streptomyces niphimycinicus]